MKMIKSIYIFAVVVEVQYQLKLLFWRNKKIVFVLFMSQRPVSNEVTLEKKTYFLQQQQQQLITCFRPEQFLSSQFVEEVVVEEVIWKVVEEVVVELFSVLQVEEQEDGTTTTTVRMAPSITSMDDGRMEAMTSYHAWD
jgi:hypothetical protein